MSTQLSAKTEEVLSLRVQLQSAMDALVEARTSEAKAMGEASAMRDTIKELKANNSWMMKLIATRFQGASLGME